MFRIPSIFKANSSGAFLKDQSDFVKAQRGSTGLKEWLTKIGITSRISFKHYLAGKRALPRDAQKNLAKSLDFSSAEAQRFDDLQEGKVNPSAVPLGEMYYISDDFFASSLNTIILNLCGIQKRMDTHQLEAILKGVFSVNEIQESVVLLLMHGLVQSVEGHLIRTFHGVVTTAPGQKSLHSQAYFKSASAMADLAWNFPLEDREMHSFTCRLDSKDIPKMKTLVRQFRKDLSAISGKNENLNSVYQCSVSAFPIYLEKDETEFAVKVGPLEKQ